MNLSNLMQAGVTLPDAIIIAQPTVDASGRLYVGLGWSFGAVEVGAWLKARPADRSVADGLCAVLEGLRKQASKDDPDSPGRLTLPEVFEVLTGVALGKR